MLDGLGDLPHIKLDHKTPLESANKPSLDVLAGNATLGYMYPVSEKMVPESDKATLHILGREKTQISRGQLEAIGAGMVLHPGDLALRANFATISDMDERRVVDRRVGRTLTTKEAQILARTINKEVKLDHPFLFVPTVQHRGVLVLRGSFSDNVSNTDPAYPEGGKFVGDIMKYAESLDEKDLSEYTAKQVNAFVRQSFEVLQRHYINQKRRLKGELPANIILTRGAGSQIPMVDKFSRWAGVAYMPLEIGIAKFFGMEVFTFSHSFKSYQAYRDLKKLLKKAAKFSARVIKKNKKKFDYFYVHFKETDLPGHDNLPFEKKEMIEILDKYFFSTLLKLRKKENFEILVTGDHATPCIKSSHSADPVPFLMLGDYRGEQRVNFCEKTCLETKNKVYGKELLKRAGFMQN